MGVLAGDVPYDRIVATQFRDLWRQAAQSYLAQIGAVRRRAADRIERRAADDQVEIGALRTERIVAGRTDRRAGLPPAVLANHHARIEAVVEARARAHAALRRLDRLPSRRWRSRAPPPPPDAAPLPDAARACAGWAARGAGSGRTASASRWSGPAGSARPDRAAPPARSAAPRNPATADSRGRGRSANTARPCREGVAKPRGEPFASGSAYLRMARLQRHPHAAGRGAQLLQRNPARRELLAIGGIDIAIPELRTEAETRRRDRTRCRCPGAPRRAAERRPGGTGCATAPRR